LILDGFGSCTQNLTALLKEALIAVASESAGHLNVAA
jgi:hypothetical protein